MPESSSRLFESIIAAADSYLTRRESTLAPASGNGWSCLIDAYQQPLPPRPEVFLNAAMAVKLRNCLLHTRAGRRHSSRLRKTYVTAEEPFRELSVSPGSFAANGSPRHIEALLKRFYDLAAMQRQIRKREAVEQDIRLVDEGEGRFVLVGPRGAGKTTFLNYLVSAHADELDEHLICWVRLNLTRPFKRGSLRSRLAYQTSWIMKKKYLDDEHRDRVSWDGLEDFLGDPDAADVITRLKSLEELDERLFDPAPEGDAVPGDLIPAGFSYHDYQRVRRYFEKEGYSFLFVIDGLDAMEPTSEHRELWRQWLDQAMDLFRGIAKGATVVLSIRSETYGVLSPLLSPVDGNGSRPQELNIARVSPMLMLAKRFALFAERFPNNALQAYNFEQLLLRYCATGLIDESNFGIARGPRVTSDDASDRDAVLAGRIVTQAATVLDELGAILQGNNRRVLRAMSTASTRLLTDLAHFHGLDLQKVPNANNENDWALSEALEDQLTKLPQGDLARVTRDNPAAWLDFCIKYRHRGMEVLVLGNNTHHCTPFCFQVDGARLHVRFSSNYGQSMGVLPNVFANPTELLDYGDEVQRNVAPFLKLIILRHLRELGELAYVSQDELKKLFGTMGVPSYAVEATLEELQYFALTSSWPASRGEINVGINTGGEFALEKLIGNHNYLMCIVESTPVPQNLARTLLLSVKDRSGVPLFVRRIWNAMVFGRYLRSSYEILARKTRRTSASAMVAAIEPDVQRISDAVRGLVGRAGYDSLGKNRGGDEFAIHVLGFASANEARSALAR